MQESPAWYADWRATLGIDRVDYGVGGIQLLLSNQMPRGQVGFAVASDGESLVGVDPGDWRPEWVVIGYETYWPAFRQHHPPTVGLDKLDHVSYFTEVQVAA